MVCIKQVSIPAVVLLSLAEQAVAAPVARRGDIAVRDAAQAVDAIDLAIRDLELDERGLGKVLGKIGSVIKKNPGKTFDRTLSSANTAMTVANTHKTVSGKRDLGELDERDLDELELALRDLEELDERDLDELELVLRDLGLDERSILGAVKKVAGGAVKAVKAVGNVIKKNPGKTFDRTLSSANTAMTVANTHKTVSGKRDLEELDERDLDELELALRDLEDRSLKGLLTPVVKATKAIKNVASKVGSTIKKNPGKAFDRTLSSANTGMAIANTHKTQTGKRDLEERDFDELEIALRDLDEIELALRDLEDRSLKGLLTPVVKATKAIKNVASKVGSTIKKNPGKAFDRTLSSANTGMAIANTHKTQTGKRDLEDIEERDVEELDERDWEDFEERDVEELDERDWEDFEERDVDDIEARGVGAVLKKVAKGAFGAMDIISKNQGKSYNRANAAANSAMKVAQTKKKQEKRGFEERDFEYLNSLSQRDLEDLELVVRALYGDYLEDN